MTKEIKKEKIIAIQRIKGLEYYLFISKSGRVYITPKNEYANDMIDEVFTEFQKQYETFNKVNNTLLNRGFKETVLISYVKDNNKFYFLKGNENISFLEKPQIIFSGYLDTMESFLEGLQIACYDVEEAYADKKGLGFLLKQGCLIIKRQPYSANH